MTRPWVGALIGLVLAIGVVLVVLGAPAARKATLEDRLSPYLQDGSAWRAAGSRRSPTVLRRAADVLDRVLGGAASVRIRLARAGLPADVEGFRVQQALWGGAAAALAGVVGSLLAAVRGAAPATVVVLVVAAALGGVLLRDAWLTRQARQREERILAEFPTIAELLALAVGAGEGAAGALDRVTRLSHGELADELGLCLADARAGASLPSALQGLADRTGVVPLRRFVDGMIVALERGTPLADVLRAQAQDVRESGRRAIMEAGGRKEVAMMVPVVFLILPITVIFAVFPGIAAIRLSV